MAVPYASHNHNTPEVAAMDSCFVLKHGCPSTWKRQKGIYLKKGKELHLGTELTHPPPPPPPQWGKSRVSRCKTTRFTCRPFQVQGVFPFVRSVIWWMSLSHCFACHNTWFKCQFMKKTLCLYHNLRKSLFASFWLYLRHVRNFRLRHSINLFKRFQDSETFLSCTFTTQWKLRRVGCSSWLFLLLFSCGAATAALLYLSALRASNRPKNKLTTSLWRMQG